MTRKKVKLAFVTNDSARKAAFKKRKKGLIKKVSELTTLCGIDSCVIIYSPYESQPEVWPNNIGVQQVLAQFKKMPEMEQNKKMVNQESFIRQRIVKGNEQLKKLQKDNREKEVTEVMYQCLIGKGLQNLIILDLNDLGWVVDQNLREIQKRMELLKKMPPPPQVESSMAKPVHGEEQKPAVDLISMDDICVQRPLFMDWLLNNPSENMGYGNGYEMMMPIAENHNAIWSSAFFP